LRRTRRLATASAILRAARRRDLLRKKRQDLITVIVDGDAVLLRDQRPLIRANLSLVQGWQFADWVEYLNHQVYFWPGDALNLVRSGRRLLQHYASESPLVLRVPFRALLAANPDIPPSFSLYNSGAARKQRGKPVKRGPDLFRAAEE